MDIVHLSSNARLTWKVLWNKRYHNLENQIVAVVADILTTECLLAHSFKILALSQPSNFVIL